LPRDFRLPGPSRSSVPIRFHHSISLPKHPHLSSPPRKQHRLTPLAPPPHRCSRGSLGFPRHSSPFKTHSLNHPAAAQHNRLLSRVPSASCSSARVSGLGTLLKILCIIGSAPNNCGEVTLTGKRPTVDVRRGGCKAGVVVRPTLCLYHGLSAAAAASGPQLPSLLAGQFEVRLLSSVELLGELEFPSEVVISRLAELGARRV